MIVIDLHLEIFALLYILILCITLLIYKLKKKNKYNIYGLILFELYILCLVKVVYTPVRIVFNRAMSDDMVEKEPFSGSAALGLFWSFMNRWRAGTACKKETIETGGII